MCSGGGGGGSVTQRAYDAQADMARQGKYIDGSPIPGATPGGGATQQTSEAAPTATTPATTSTPAPEAPQMTQRGPGADDPIKTTVRKSPPRGAPANTVAVPGSGTGLRI